MNQIDYENLGTRMKELRIKMKLTQAEVARALNVTPGYISNVENNRTAMSLRILIYYARLLNISWIPSSEELIPNTARPLWTVRFPSRYISLKSHRNRSFSRP